MFRRDFLVDVLAGVGLFGVSTAVRRHEEKPVTNDEVEIIPGLPPYVIRVDGEPGKWLFVKIKGGLHFVCTWSRIWNRDMTWDRECWEVIYPYHDPTIKVDGDETCFRVRIADGPSFVCSWSILNTQLNLKWEGKVYTAQQWISNRWCFDGLDARILSEIPEDIKCRNLA